MPSESVELEDGLRYERSGALDRALACYRQAAQDADPCVAAEAWSRISRVHRMHSAWDDALEAARRGAEMAREARLADCLADALIAEAAVHQCRGHFGAAVGLLEQIPAISENDRVRGAALQNLGAIAAQTGDLETAQQRFLESFRAFRRAQYRRGEVFALNNYAAAAMDRGQLELAEEVLARAADAAREIEDLELLALATKNQAEVLAGLGKLAQAEELASAALGYFDATGDGWRRVECFLLLGDLQRDQVCLDAARGCYEKGLALAETLGAQMEIAKLSQRLATLRESAEPRGGTTSQASTSQSAR